MNLMRPLVWVARAAGVVVAVVGAVYLAGWLSGYMAARGATAITMKTNTALALVLLGAGLVFLTSCPRRRFCRWAVRICACLPLLIGLLTFSEHVVGWNLGIDQLLATEPPGALGATQPNRMGVATSVNLALAGAALLLLGANGRRIIIAGQGAALALCVVALLGTVGYLYDVEPLYAVPWLTGVALPTALALLALGIGLLCVRADRGLMAVVTADDAGGRTIRRLLPVCVGLPLVVGYLRLLGERAGLYTPPLGTALVMLLFIVLFSWSVYVSSRGLSRRETQQRADQEALRQGEQQFRLAQQATRTGSFEWNVQTGVNAWTPELETMYGLQRGQFGKTESAWEQLVHPEDRAAMIALVERTHETGEITESEWRVIWPDGSIHWIYGRFQAIKDDSGHPLRLFGVNIEITERKRAQEALRKYEQQYRMLFEAIDEGFCIIEVLFDVNQQPVDYRFLEINPAFEKQTGLRDAVGKRMRELVPAHEKHWFEIYGKVALTGQAIRFENRAAALGRDYDVYAFRVGQPQERRVAILFNDISHRKLTEQSLLQHRDELERRVAERTAELEHRARQLARLTSELTLAEQRERQRLAQVLHDHLQQLLVGAKFGLELLSRQATEHQQPAVEQVRGLLDESIKASRALTAELSPPILQEAGLGAGLEWLTRWMHDKHGLAVELAVDADICPEREDIRVLLFQSVRELLFNVVKHAGVTAARVQVTRHDPDHIRVVVSDEGTGFGGPEAVQPGGSLLVGGFGLFSIRERLHLIGGRLDVATGPGQGTRITLVAPCQVTEAPARGATATARRARETAEALIAVEARQAGKTGVLLVDDHTVMREGLSQLLQTEEDLVVIGQAADGQEAVELARRLRPDVILMDSSMPGMDGVEATRQIHGEQPGVRIIGLSMYDEADRARAMLDAGAVSYLSKSGSPDLLLSAIRQQDDPRA